MSDDKKSPPPPLKDPKVGITVTPKDEKNPEHKKIAETVKKALKEKVDKAIEENKPGGGEKQFNAVKKEAKKAGQATDPSKIKEIRVGVRVTDEEGDKDTREQTVTAKEGKKTP